MAPVIDDHVKRPMLSPKVAHELRVRLITPMHMDPGFHYPLLIYVETVNLASAKVVPPHSQGRPAPSWRVVTSYSNLEQANWLRTKLLKVDWVKVGVRACAVMIPRLVAPVHQRQRGQAAPNQRPNKPLEADCPFVTKTLSQPIMDASSMEAPENSSHGRSLYQNRPGGLLVWAGAGGVSVWGLGAR
jgi:hypothetical protein